MSRWNTVKVAAWICVSGAVAPFYWEKKKKCLVFFITKLILVHSIHARMARTALVDSPHRRGNKRHPWARRSLGFRALAPSLPPQPPAPWGSAQRAAGPRGPVPPSLRLVRPGWAPLTPDAVQTPVCSQGNKSVSWFWSCPGIPMESITVYQKIPHPGIQVNLNSYYSEQVSAVLGRTGRADRRGVRPSLSAWSRPLAV